jgi:hypothetical protein
MHPRPACGQCFWIESPASLLHRMPPYGTSANCVWEAHIETKLQTASCVHTQCCPKKAGTMIHVSGARAWRGTVGFMCVLETNLAKFSSDSSAAPAGRVSAKARESAIRSLPPALFPTRSHCSCTTHCILSRHWIHIPHGCTVPVFGNARCNAPAKPSKFLSVLLVAQQVALQRGQIHPTLTVSTPEPAGCGS